MPETNVISEQATRESVGPSPSAGSLADSVMRTIISSGNDARDLLFSAVRTDNEGDPSTRPAAYSTSPSFLTTNAGHEAQITLSAVQVWSSSRFVMQGWLAAPEAVRLVDLYVRDFDGALCWS